MDPDEDGTVAASAGTEISPILSMMDIAPTGRNIIIFVAAGRKKKIIIVRRCRLRSESPCMIDRKSLGKVHGTLHRRLPKRPCLNFRRRCQNHREIL